jgi:acetyltransferase-like isoleucine patch superfamily enzyme
VDPARLPWRLRYEAWRDVGSSVRRLGIKLAHRHCAISFGPGCHLGPGFELVVPGRAVLRVGSGVVFRRGFTCEIAEGGEVTIGDGCIFSWGTVIQCSTTVDIGADCRIAAHALIVDGNYRFKDPGRPAAEQGYDFRPISIGASVIIGHAATIINDVGERAFVGANAVVTRPVPPFSVAVGAPARVVDRFGPPAEVEAGGT